MFTSIASRRGIIALLVGVSAIALIATTSFSRVKAGGEKAAIFTGTAGAIGFEWDYDFNGNDTTDCTNVATFVKGGAAQIEGLILPALATSGEGIATLGPGHGKWRLNEESGKVKFKTYHSEPLGSPRFFVVEGKFALNDADSGTATITAYDGKLDTVPAFVVETHFSTFDLSDFD